ncbi:hypothetical protein ROLI_036730 [Roseobacter fucihabitans]|uniref:HTH luxR-type domain-containing protein n=1 Tax=Roseobacter fucihabitans TaxID=1537242 RepID=A0ABZ2BZG2_9RHOB|nr:helix-turn-helix transcriptional regulator [Roseobacter litoralis]MBC6966326.1 Bacterial regulatory protein, luxR family [Roseobacter litoralis]
MSYHSDISGLYASALDDQALSAALSRLQRHVHSSFLHVLAFDTQIVLPVDGIVSGPPEADTVYRETWAAGDLRVPRGLALPRDQIWHQTQLFSDAERQSSPIYNEWLKENDAQQGMGMMTALSPTLVICTSAFRPDRLGGYGEPETALWQDIHRHLMALIALRHTYLRAQLSDPPALQTQTAAIHMDKTGRVVHVTPPAEALLGAACGIDIQRGRVRLGTPSRTAQLEARYQRVREGAPSPPLRLRIGSGREMLVLSVVPAVAPCMSPTGFDWPDMTLFLRRLSPSPVLDPQCVAEVFELTPTEAEIACALATGATALQIATQRGRALSTVRWTIRNILEKLEIRRQSDLRVLFSRLS